MQFLVMTDDGPKSVKFLFGRSADLAQVSRWRAPAVTATDARVRDALEFRKLAGKRWRYYFRGNEAATSVSQLQGMIRREPSSEAGFILIARATWSRAIPVIGCAFCRRSWCHHLIVDFIVVHPRIVATVGPSIRGVGAGMIYGIVNLAEEL